MKAKNLAEWRQIVLQRDNHTCVNCGAQTNLLVDHIEPRRAHPELVLETDNGRVLCTLCHLRIGKRTSQSSYNHHQILYVNPMLQGKTLYSRLYWPTKLRPDGYADRVDVREGAYCLVIPKPGALSKDLSNDLRVISKYFKLKAGLNEESKEPSADVAKHTNKRGRIYNKASNEVFIGASGVAHWPVNLRHQGYTGILKILDSFGAVLIPKPGASNKDIAKTLELMTQDFKYRAQKEGQE